VKTVFFFTDVHGAWDLYETIINYCLSQDPDCTIIFGGDACDRGPDGYKIIKHLLSCPNVIYLMGNHEMLFVDAAKAIAKYNLILDEAIEDDAVALHIYNGGYMTLQAWIEDGKPMNLIDKLEALPVGLRYKNLDFCHAGGNPKVFEHMLETGASDEDDISHLTWDRNCLGLGWTPERICIFGHTPVMYLPKKYYQTENMPEDVHPSKYLGQLDEQRTGMKIDMDTGACFTGIAYVLNCDTMQAQGFEDTDIENPDIRKHEIEKIDIIQF